MPRLDIKTLQKEARDFSRIVSNLAERSLYGVTDGKAVGTHLEHKFKAHLKNKYTFNEGNSASGIDFPGLYVDLKVTSISQPQSSCPFKSARQKIFGLGYSLLVFVYQKVDTPKSRAATLNILHTIYLDKEQTGDYQTTSGILNILGNNGNKDDIMAFIFERNLPVEEIEAGKIAEEVLKKPPKQGYLTISNALQWRLQYGRAIEFAGQKAGVISVYRAK